MKILAIETSTKNFSLAVYNGDRVTHFRNVVLDKVLSSSIIPGIRRILKDSGIAATDLDGLAVGLGPGSFTSLRVGLATVKGLSMALRKPVVGIPSPDILASNALPLAARTQAAAVLTMGDARRNLVFSCLFVFQKGRLVRKSSYRLTPLEDAVSGLRGKIVVIGDGISQYREDVLQRCAVGENDFVPEFAPPATWFPQARQLAVMAALQLQKGRVTRPALVKPLYLYPADCQVHRT